jgi:hypothetical protein
MTMKVVIKRRRRRWMPGVGGWVVVSLARSMPKK